MEHLHHSPSADGGGLSPLKLRNPLGIALLAVTACGCATRQTPGPSVSLSPSDVVQIQVLALQHINEPTPNAGVWTTFQFASPANRRVTGPYGHFLRLIKSQTNYSFLHARAVRFYPVRQDDTKAEREVELTDENGQATRWLLSLSRQQSGKFENCWMTDGVTRVEGPEKSGGL